MRFCPFAQRTRLVLAHKNIPHETVNVHLRPVEAKPNWFLERNPLGLVPVLEKDGKIVYESVVCNEYLEAMYPEKKLLPSDPFELAQQKMLQERLGKMTGPAMKYRMSGGSEETFSELQNFMKLPEEVLGKQGNFFAGDNVGMIDYNLWPFFERVETYTVIFNREILPKDKFPRLRAYIERMMSLPAVKECYTTPEQMLEFGKSSEGGNPNYDLGLKE
ncbi:hypothetical protein FSP39_015463 [Pinctada imbricata]|uniref:Glutathione S-transferase omega n=1 Tax=Pinctada imbricata TaxID=66713 RepID=A0AA88XJ86_PINIB|nr:hypothetical protein FSP39_015463 [Pinctada imbricata]